MVLVISLHIFDLKTLPKHKKDNKKNPQIKPDEPKQFCQTGSELISWPIFSQLARSFSKLLLDILS